MVPRQEVKPPTTLRNGVKTKYKSRNPVDPAFEFDLIDFPTRFPSHNHAIYFSRNVWDVTGGEVQ